MKNGLIRLLKVVVPFIFILINGFKNPAAAQTAGSASRISVVSNDSKTKIWISDFPKKTNVVITDVDNNLLSLISTNEYGAAFVVIPAGIKTDLIVKTMNGEISATNKTVIRDDKGGNKVASFKDNTETAPNKA